MKYIDIESIIKESDSGTLKKLPKFVIWLVKKIIREDEMNAKLSLYGEMDTIPFLNKVIEVFNLKIDLSGIENLPETPRCFFAGNHPFGVIDGLMITHTVSGKYGHLKAIGNDAFMFLPPLRPFIAAVNVYGRNQKDVVRQLDELFASDTPITHFPAGEVSRLYKWKIQDTKWQKSFITKSIAHKRTIVPFYFGGRNSILFHTIFVLRKMLGIKANVELILLPHEMFNKKNKKLKVIIGKPVPHTVFDNRHNHNEWSRLVRAYTYSLKKYPDRDFEEFLAARM